MRMNIIQTKLGAKTILTLGLDAATTTATLTTATTTNNPAPAIEPDQ